ncbi:MAG: Zinc finger and SCAN domain-containing protein 5B [Icmadophila ericetorum]|nr:Zinc finger and SCAN domain-containing protein 5B [Icmadophila ericetorum]
MAEPPTAAPNPGTPQAASADIATLPSTPTSLVAPANVPKLAENSKFLKPTSPRKRRRSPESVATSLADELLRKSPAPIPPTHLTAAAELKEQKRRREMIEREQSSQKSPNPVKAILGALVGDRGMSRPQDAPAPATTLNEAVAAIAPIISIPTTTQGDNSMQISPVSMSSFGTLDSAGGGTITANGPQVSSPGRIGDDTGLQTESPQRSSLRPEEEEAPSNKAMTFPGPLLTPQPADARRGMSLPGSGYARDESKSPSSSNKKHKCPYCATEFTRHHNLKSHLLTHSHEKPYMCQTCDSRFRRLHDLKRHTKLHTGERPHVCPKCKRSFARGDALARHNKGQGGCAGRRSSAGSYGDNSYDLDAPGEEGMDGLVYTGEASQEPENMDDDGEEADDRRKSLPSIRRHEPPDPHYRQHQEGKSGYQRQPSTYPPVAARQSTLHPPSGGHVGGSNPSMSPGSQSTSLNAYSQGAGGSFSNTNVFAQTTMTESPKPLSPGGLGPHSGFPDPSIHRNRSPSLTQQFQQQQYGRRTQGRPTPPPAVALGPPMNPSAHSNAPHLPSLPGLNPPDPRYTLHSQTSVTPAGAHGPPQTLLSQPQAQTSGPHPPSTTNTQSSYHTHSQQGSTGSIIAAGPPGGTLSSHSNSLGSSHAGSGERANLPFPTGELRLWAYVQSLEARIDRLSGEVDRLNGIVTANANANTNALSSASRAGSIVGPGDSAGPAAVANMTPSTNTIANVNTSGNGSGDSNTSGNR